MKGQRSAAGPLREVALPSWLGLLLILGATAWLYLPALGTPFFADDYLFLDQVRSRPLLTSLLIPDPLSNFYRPVSRQLYFWLISHATHESPLAFHVANLAVFLLVLALLFALVRRLAGERAALIAVALLAVHYTADVTVRWACGSQDLLAVAGALGALLLYISGQRVLAGAAMLLAALSKEVVLLAPLIAIVADHRARESWVAASRRAWPLAMAIVVWGLIWLAMPHRHAQQGTEVEFDPTSPFAALVHLVQITWGLEWRKGDFGHLPRVLPPWLPLAVVLVAVVTVAKERGSQQGRRERRHPKVAPAAEAHAGARPGSQKAPAADTHASREGNPNPDRRRAIVLGILWAVLASAPVAAVAILWSAYYYLFAMCGVALALGAWLASRSRWWAIAVIVAVAWGSASARELDEFATPRSPWTGQSHINHFYIDRATRYARRYLEDLRRARPSFPHASTLFFAGLKSNIAFLAGDGPLVRWAYRDSSLRSYYLNTFNLEKARRGPVFYFIGSGDSLREMDQGPDLLSRIAFGMLVSDKPESARDALELERQRDPKSDAATYWRAWVEWDLSDTTRAIESLRRAGVEPDRGPTPEMEQALRLLNAGDTLQAFHVMQSAVSRHALDPSAHALLADLALVSNPNAPGGAIEAYATRVLVPRDPFAWRRWAMVQTKRERYLEALSSFQRYFALGGAIARQDAEAERWAAAVKAMLPGGELAPEGQRE